MTQKKKNKKPRQLSFFNPEMETLLGTDGWHITFKPSSDSQVFTAIGKLNDVYDALKQWIDDYPDYYSAVIYAPSGKIHRTLKKPDKAR